VRPTLQGDTFPNVGAECAAGVAGIVGALGEVAASGTLAMTSCKEYPMAGRVPSGKRVRNVVFPGLLASPSGMFFLIATK